MSDREETVWVVFNGEIYNFPELRSELQAFGHVFRTRCDTEVIVLGYKQWGVEEFNRLNAMFGLATWTVRKWRFRLSRARGVVNLRYFIIAKSRSYFVS